ncbi:MAG: transglutaminase family protein [Candidatus Bathyarchaeia archaeon]
MKKNQSKIPDNKGPEDFLRPSELCDSDNPLVKSTAEEITKNAKTPKDAAIKIFYFVRDKIPLAFVNPNTSASETLRVRKGSCFTKATLQMALLRAIGIPARFRIMEFKGNDPEEWEGILPSLAVSMMPERWPHYFVEVYIEGRWIMADATFDRALLPDTEDWNGEYNVCSIEPRAILSDMGAFAFIEEEARKLDELYRVPVLWIMNSYRSFWILNLYLRVQRFKNKL